MAKLQEENITLAHLIEGLEPFEVTEFHNRLLDAARKIRADLIIERIPKGSRYKKIIYQREWKRKQSKVVE